MEARRAAGGEKNESGIVRWTTTGGDVECVSRRLQHWLRVQGNNNQHYSHAPELHPSA